MNNILCIEDSPETILILKNTLREYSLEICSTVKEAQELINRNQYQVILIDIELPDGRGHELMPLLKDKFLQTSVIFLTSHSEFQEKEMAFMQGAVDFIQKPFDPRELKLRIETQLRRLSLQNENTQIVKIGDLTCNLEEQKVYPDGNNAKAMDLTSIEYKIFRLLSKNPQKALSREEILDKIWGDSISITARTVDVHISNLRRKLSDTKVSIHHKHGYGYYLST